MHKFTHIDAFYQVARYVEVTNENPECPERYKIREPVSYRGTVKLHGANAGVVCTPDALRPQSRSRAISVQDDNYGFAAFVAQDQVASAVRSLEAGVRERDDLSPDAALVLFGEWIGPGIQRGVAVNQLPARQWVLFGAKVFDDSDGRYIDAVGKLADRFVDIGIGSIFDGPSFELTVDFDSNESKEAAVKHATEVTAAVAAQCPWAHRFGVDGTGEGVVWTPAESFRGRSELFFKTKGDKHAVTKSKRERPKIAPEVLANIEAFLEFSLTEARLTQGLSVLTEMGLPHEMKSLGSYLKWVGQDVKRECALELEASQLEWKDVGKAVTARAKAFFLESLRVT